MNLNLTDPKLIVLAAVVILVIAVLAWLNVRKRRSTTADLRQRFGPEYERAVREHGWSERKAEANLAGREMKFRAFLTLVLLFMLLLLRHLLRQREWAGHVYGGCPLQFVVQGGSTGDSLRDRHDMFALRQTARTGPQSPDIQSQGRNCAGERVSVHPQFVSSLALISVVFPQHRRDEGFPELPDGFGVENPAFVHLAYKCVEFAFHGPRSLKRYWRSGALAEERCEQATPAETWRSITQMMCNRAERE